MGNVIITEAGHEEVRVIIAVVVAQGQAVQAGLLDSRLEVLGQQLALLVEVVGGADVDEGVERAALPPLHQLGGVVAGPLGAVVGAEVAGEGLLAPGAADGVGDGGEGGDAPVEARVAQVEGEGAVAAHGVAGDGDAAAVEQVAEGGGTGAGAGGEEGGGELGGQVRLHAVVGVEGRAGGVEVEGGGLAEVPGVPLAGQVEPARGRVRVDDGDVVPAGGVLEEGLLGGVVGGAGQAREPDEDGDLLAAVLGLGALLLQLLLLVPGGGGGG